MMPGPTRNEIAFAVMAIAACFGVSNLFVGMANQRLQRAQTADTRARLTAESAELNAHAHTRNLELSDWVRTAVTGINTANQHAASAASLYDDYTALADRLGLKPGRIAPTTAISRTSPGRRNTRAATIEAGPEPIAYHAELDGTIEAITRFLDTIEHDLGHTRIINARITPIGISNRPITQDDADQDSQLPVRLSITTLHYRFDPPKVHASLIASAPTETNP